ncbi:hypothetical protein ACN47E_001431 [Coniothyrium glycines]
MYRSENPSLVHSSIDSDSSIVHTEDGTSQGFRETRLVIGLDYGTTYTGVAYATPSGNECDLNEIDVVIEWGRKMEDKVPSVISYSGDHCAWAYDVSGVTMVHTKLELGLQSLMGEMDLTLQVLEGMGNLNFDEMFEMKDGPDRPTYSHKTPEDIVTDYLSKVFEYLEQDVDKFGDVARKHTTTDIVVTVPTEWSYVAKNSTYRAMMKAGFNRINFPSLQDVLFITEAEAAAQYTARHYRDEENQVFLQKGQYFILCDAGGGTVDVVSYQVKQLSPVLQLDQVGEPTGNKSGSIFINMEFKKWLRNQLGDDYYRELDPRLDIEKYASHASETPAMRSLMKDFDHAKKNFGTDNRVYQGLLTIRRHEMEKFFDDSVYNITMLIKDHIRRIRRERKNRPKNLFLVGGYGTSEYLKAQIADMLEEENMTMHLRTPRESWTAVVRGAVVCGIEKAGNTSLKRTNSCRHSYAFCQDEIYADSHHSSEDAVQIGALTYAQSQLDWILSKGDLILADEPTFRERSFILRLSRRRLDTLKLPIWRNLSHESERPVRFDDASDELKKAGELDIDLEKVDLKSSNFHYEVKLRLVLLLEWDVLRASVWWDDKQLSTTQLEYD